MADKDIYQAIAIEIDTKKVDAALWAQATAIGMGDSGKTQSAYIRLRFEELKSAASPPSVAFSRPVTSSEDITSQDDVALKTRVELKKKLYVQRKSSLYATLGLQPDASDTVVAAAISDLEANHLAGAISAAELKYAKTILGDPESRKQYDQKLMQDMRSLESVRIRTYAYDEAEKDTPLWSARNTSIVIGVLSLAIFGYWGVDFFRATSDHEVKKASVDVQRDAVGYQHEEVLSSVEIEKQRIQTESELRLRAMALEEEKQRRQMDYQAQAQDRIRAEQEKRDAMEQQRTVLAQQQTENRNTQRERQYWTCINQQMSNSRISTSDAYARCAMYRPQ